MKKIVGNKNTKHSVWSAAALGIATSLVFSVIGMIIGTFLIDGGKLSETSYFVVSAVIWCLAVFVGSLLASKISEGQSFIVSVITLLGYLLILAAIQILFFDSQFYKIWKTILLCAAGTLPTVLISQKSLGRKKVKIKYRRT